MVNLRGMSSKLGAEGYTLRRDGNSAEVIEGKGDVLRPLRRRARKRLKAMGLNQSREKGTGRGARRGRKSMLELNKHAEL